MVMNADETLPSMLPSTQTSVTVNDLDRLTLASFRLYENGIFIEKTNVFIHNSKYEDLSLLRRHLFLNNLHDDFICNNF